ncbi:MAG: DUF3025 domain-containing protein [Thiobacillaceae bacterium]|nr:DUF3025 domain-containing protein [Thiobacillaceae bacterium]
MSQPPPAPAPAASPPPWRPDFASAPLFASIAPVARGFAGHAAWPELAELDRLAAAAGIVNDAGRPLRFVAQTTRHGQRDYEARILSSGEVPTRRANWHDLLNALAWLAFPRAKAALNAVQCLALAESSPGRRPARSDAATLFDESGLVLLARDDELAGLLRARRWEEAFWTRRSAWREARCLVFGHALLEKALRPFPAMTGKCLFLPVDDPTDAEVAVDAAVAGAWRAGGIARPADLFPLPVLGIPGVWPDNERAEFYAQRSVFRPAARPRRAATIHSE